MIISTTKNSFWEKGTETTKTDINAKIDFGAEKQTVRGFGGKAYTLEAESINTIIM